MIIKRSQVQIWLLIAIVFFGNNCFYIFPSSPFWGLLTFGSGICLILISKIAMINNISKKWFWYVIASIGVSVVSLLYTVASGMQDLVSATYKYYPIIVGLLISLPILGDEKLCRMIPVIIKRTITVVVVVFIVQILLGSNHTFLHSQLQFRNGMYRFFVAQIWIAVLGVLYLNDLMNSRSKRYFLIYLTSFVIVTLYITFVVQSRSLEFAYIMAVGAYTFRHMIVHSRNSRLRSILSLLAAFLIVFVLVLGYRYAISSIMNSLSAGESSSVTRIQAYQYYWNLFQSHPIWGIGMMRDQFNSGFAQIGVYENLFLDDIGVVGFIAQFGSLGVILVMWLILLMIRSIHDDISFSLVVLLLILLPFNFLQNSSTDVILESLLICGFFSNHQGESIVYTKLM